jgi:hypothetical protein
VPTIVVLKTPLSDFLDSLKRKFSEVRL